MEVVDNLGQDAGPVDRVDSTQPEGGVDIGVCKESLDNVLSWE